MKAVVYDRYGAPDVLELREVDKPVVRDDEVLIAVHAASVNSWDWERLRGKPFVGRIGEGLLKPKNTVLGADMSGRIEAVGRTVTKFAPGDEVFGDISGCGWGGFAEYVCAREDALALKPAAMSFEEAAAVPQAGVLALQGLRDKGRIQPGQEVLVNGAGGGAGSFAIQIAKTFGTTVTGVDSTPKLELMRSIGADHVIDYTQHDFTDGRRQYDLVLDVATHHSLFESKRVLSKDGSYVIVGGATAYIFQAMVLGPFLSIIGKQRIRVLLYRPNSDLTFLTELIEAGKIVPVIDRRYTLSDVAEAVRYVEEGRAQGKVVVSV